MDMLPESLTGFLSEGEEGVDAGFEAPDFAGTAVFAGSAAGFEDFGAGLDAVFETDLTAELDETV
ncbi:hypothetical protein [Methanolapillus millepedarum]|uniref:hypothetical protein n=1 Tax=Methanolapillus millepedarum TaxID=3028296 RepID=UPI0030B909EF